MARPESRRSNSSLRVWSFLHRLAGRLDDATETRVANEFLGHQVHGTLKQTLDGFGRIQVAIGVGWSG
jgi:hypothetical protein